MSFPDPTAPPHVLTSPPLSGGGDSGGGFWPQFMSGADQQQHPQNHQNLHMDSIPQFHSQNHNPPPFKRVRPSEKLPNYPRTATNPPTLPGNRGTSHIFYKTRICAKFMEGTCRNGEHCTFAHGPEDLREPPPNWQDLIREKERAAGGSSGGGSGSGSGAGWGDDHRVVHRMKICKKYYNGEECPYGDKCNFLHERGPQPPVKKFKVEGPGPGERESAVISIGTTGDVRIGSGDQAVFWKTKMCSKWEMGQCRYGERCHFAHGPSDMMLGDEPETVGSTNVAIPRKPTAFTHSTTPPPNMVVAGGAVGDGGGGVGGEEKKSSSKWKLSKKINRIYADWLDDMSPPRSLPNMEEM